MKSITFASLLGALCLCGLLGLSACTDDKTYSSGNNSDSETHWLEACDQDSDCGELSCLCGVCTQPCQGDAACQELGGSPICISSTSTGALCGADPIQLCWSGCAQDSDCDFLSQGVCDNGQCVQSGDNNGDMDALLCEQTEGRWEPSTCGHFRCGLANECAAVIPGCDCGAGRNFGPQGCFDDEACGPGPGNINEVLCQDSGGTWDPTACGHARCGAANDCDAIEPGCNCGPGANFIEGQGCQEDDACTNLVPDDPSLCQDSGGTWDQDTCGHYQCGQESGCLAIIPGCDCGASANFVAGQGCMPDASCGGQEQDLCEQTEGRWEPTACGHFRCGLANECAAVIPGCDCGAGRNFGPQGCFDDDACGPNPGNINEVLCQDSGGTWDPTACGHARCGAANDCDAIEPGCNCGPGANFIEGQGCAQDNSCEQPGEQALCEQTEGRWDEASCGHHPCGGEPLCDAIIPGCDCGEGRNFFPGRGCQQDSQCSASAMLCEQTGGDWDAGGCYESFYTCGAPGDCTTEEGQEPTGACDCGPLSNFDAEQGCAPSPACEAQNQPGDEALCRSMVLTQWDAGGCGHAACGVTPVSCDESQASCTCDSRQAFVPGRGCVYASACPERPTNGIWTVDPQSITFYSLPINSIRYAVAGYIPEARACVAAIWFESDAQGAGALRCDGAGNQPYLHIELDQDGPCQNWDYSGNLEQTAPYEGCVDFAGTDQGQGLNYADLAFTVQSESYTGRIALTNTTLFEAPLPVGLRHNAQASSDLYVQSRDLSGQRGWFRLKDIRGRQLMADDPCGVPACGGQATVCVPAQVEPLASQGQTGIKMGYWDGYLRVIRPEGCFERVAAWTWGSNLSAEFCYGTGVQQVGQSQQLTGERCVQVENAVQSGFSPARILGTVAP